MNQSVSPDLFQLVLTSLLDSNPDESRAHVVDDDELLFEWSVGQLPASECQQIQDHLSHCAYCREEVAEMVQAGALVFLPPENQSEGGGWGRREASLGRSVSGWRRVSLLAASVAILLLGAFSYLMLTEEDALQLAEQQLQQGQPRQSLATLEEYFQVEPEQSPEARLKAETLLNQAAIEITRQDLETRHFADVLQTVRLVSQFTEPTAELWNLRLQAEFGVPGSYSLALNDSLPDYGYELNALQTTKSFPIWDEQTSTQRMAWEQALHRYPDSRGMRLNLGYLLLRQREWEAAKTQFQKVLESDPVNALALTGSGLLAFEMQDYPLSRDYFQQALKQDPERAGYQINLAMVLEQLKQGELAKTHWETAAGLTSDADLRTRISRHLQQPVTHD